jgi:hypothetical protein
MKSWSSGIPGGTLVGRVNHTRARTLSAAKNTPILRHN